METKSPLVLIKELSTSIENLTKLVMDLAIKVDANNEGLRTVDALSEQIKSLQADTMNKIMHTSTPLSTPLTDTNE